MIASRFSEEQIIKAIKEAEVGRKVPDICRDLGVSEATFVRPRPTPSCLSSQPT